MTGSLESFRTRLISELRDSGAGSRIVGLIVAAPSSEIEALASTLDESPYGIRDWAQALVTFERWQAGAARELPLERMREYLGCCVEGAGSGAPLVSLEELLRSYLETHGVK